MTFPPPRLEKKTVRAPAGYSTAEGLLTDCLRGVGDRSWLTGAGEHTVPAPANRPRLRNRACFFTIAEFQRRDGDIPEDHVHHRLRIKDAPGAPLATCGAWPDGAAKSGAAA